MWLYITLSLFLFKKKKNNNIIIIFKQEEIFEVNHINNDLSMYLSS